MLGICPPEKKKQVEKDKQMNVNTVPKKQNPHFSLTVEVKKGDEGYWEGLCANLLLRIKRKTSSKQNADLLEALLGYFELLRLSEISAVSSSVATTCAITSPLEAVQPLPTLNVQSTPS